MENIIISTIKEWNISNYFILRERYSNSYNFHLITTSEELSYKEVKKLNPKFIFFPHWSEFISEDIYSNFNCIVFHMTDLPFGRGGSPLQNLIEQGVYKTKISALKVEKKLDSGDIYLKIDLDISSGSAQEIFIKTSNIIFNTMIPEFLKNKVVATSQSGKITIFKRRNPSESNIQKLNTKSLSKLYDFIRMLDAKDYPKAYLEVDKVKIEFSNVHKKNGKLFGKFEVIEHE